VRLTIPATPELPLPPTPVGKLTEVALPTFERHCGETALRYAVNAYVSPEPSER
jgi:hypothetical protein